MPSDPRRAVGQLGERIAESHLARTGYTVVERNFRTRSGELDLVVVGRGCLVFCEVRTRVSSPGSRDTRGPSGPLESIGPAKRRRLRRLAREWLSERDRPRTGAGSLRFDAIGVTLTPSGGLLALEHVENAF